MGGSLSLPEPNERTKKCILLARLSPPELHDFYKLFRKLDVDKTGFVRLNKLFSFIEYRRNLFSDTLLELLDMQNDGSVDFSEFLDIVITYCLFEPFQIMKFCFFVFDQDKNGYFEPEELKLLMNILHGIKQPNKATGTVKKSWYNLEIAEDDRIVFEEFEKFNRQFPWLFEPAYQLQIKLINTFMGESWWSKKKRKLQDIKDAKKAKEDRKVAKKMKRKEQVRANKTRKKMGLLRYYFCPCFRSFFTPPVKPEPTVDQVLLEKQRKEEEIKKARKLADLEVKNPETAEWQKFERKIDPEKGGDESYIEHKVVKIKRERNVRVEERKDRKERRKEEVQKDQYFAARPKLNDLPEV